MAGSYLVKREDRTNRVQKKYCFDRRTQEEVITVVLIVYIAYLFGVGERKEEKDVLSMFANLYNFICSELISNALLCMFQVSL